MKYNYVIIVLSIFCLFFTSCQKKQKSIVNEYEAPIPIQKLQSQETIIYLHDFVDDISTVDSVVINEKKIAASPVKKQLILYSQHYNSLYILMKIWQSAKSTDVVLKKSNKINYLFSFDPHGIRYDSVMISAGFNSWCPQKTKLELRDSVWQKNIFLEPGKYPYQLVLNDKQTLDPSNPKKLPNNLGGENSILEVGIDNRDKKPKLFLIECKGKSIDVKVLNEVDEVYVLWNNKTIDSKKISESLINIKIPEEANKFELSHIRIYAYNKYGNANDILIPLENGNIVKSIEQLPRYAHHSKIIYNVFVDRFYDANEDNNNPLPDSIVKYAANYQGGDIEGVISKIKEGYFQDLGVNTLWLSPLVMNTEGAYGYWPEPKTRFSAYHGYWPTSFTQINPHFGSSDDLKNMVQKAHDNNINILLDIVANHVHKEHPYYIEDTNRATPMILPDGRRNLELWDEQRLTTWFDTHLPTLDLENEHIANTVADSAMWWAKNFGIDGFRHDAAKHVPLNFWRCLTLKLKNNISNHDKFYQLGETYGNSELIDSYVSGGMLNAQFDFNVYDAAITTFAAGNDMKILKAKLQESIDVYGYHNIMAYITGNQDRARFISYAGGEIDFDEDAKKAGWTRNIGVGDKKAYKKLQMLMAFNMTIPGIPVIYYGDEFGMPGANDPDCRRMMRFGDDLCELEKNNIDITKKLISIRKSNMALLYGDIYDIKSDKYTIQFSRRYFKQFSWVGINNSDKEILLKFEVPSNVDTKKLKLNFGSQINIENNVATVTIQANSFEIITIK